MANESHEKFGTVDPDGNLFNSLLGEYYMSIRIGDYKRPKPFSNTTFQHTKLILLPLPQELRHDTAVNYSSEDLTTVDDIINGSYRGAVASAAMSASGTLLSGGISSTIGAGVGAITSAGANQGTAQAALGDKFSGLAQQAVSNIIPPGQLTSAIQQGMGMAPNPNPSVMFRGPQLRDFAYTWTLLPRNK